MASFQPYSGNYTDAEEFFRWSCYATCRVYEIRSLGKTALPRAPGGRKWVERPQRQPSVQKFSLLIDDKVAEFSQMLTQVNLAAQIDAAETVK